MKDIKNHIKAAIELMITVGNLIRELGRVPNGELYIRMMPYMSLETYTAMIEKLKDAKLIREENHVLIWIPDPALN